MTWRGGAFILVSFDFAVSAAAVLQTKDEPTAMQRITLRMTDAEELSRLIKDLRTLRRNCLDRGGTRRVTVADARGNSVVFEADFGLAGPAPKEPDRTDPIVQPNLFDLGT